MLGAHVQSFNVREAKLSVGIKEFYFLLVSIKADRQVSRGYRPLRRVPLGNLTCRYAGS